MRNWRSEEQLITFNCQLNLSLIPYPFHFLPATIFLWFPVKGEEGRVVEVTSFCNYTDELFICRHEARISQSPGAWSAVVGGLN